jgi:hypothetical protein
MRRLFALLLAGILVTSACTAATSNAIAVMFPTEGKCAMEGPTTIPSGKDVALEVVSHVTEHDTVGLAILRLDPGKSVADLEDLTFDAPQPPWTLRVGFYEFPSDGASHSVVLNQVDGPIYFLCMTPSENVGALGPLEVE